MVVVMHDRISLSWTSEHHPFPYDAEVTENSVSAGPGSDVGALLVAALLTYSGGVLMLVGYLLLDGVFGAILGIVAAVFGVVWWRKVHDDKVFPRRVKPQGVIILAVVGALLTIAAFALAA
jgi:hypothetical protein